ncbi:MAG: hypothetical protein ACI8W7_000537, partial [Gammaproteobacteria bacterium]
MQVEYRIVIALLLVFSQCVLGTSAMARDQQALSVVRISPAGDNVPLGRQIVIQFNRAVVPLGKMTRAAHQVRVRIQPRLDCQWRWLDQSALACDLPPEQTFASATRYRLVLDPGIATLDGATLPAPLEHTFVTTRPQLQWANIDTWLTPQRPVLRVNFNQAVSRDSVRAHLFFRASADRSSREPAQVVAAHEDGMAVLGANASPAQIAHAALLGSLVRRSWLVAPRTALSADTQFALHVEPGVLALGPQAGVEQRAVSSFATFAPFAFVGVRCTDIITQRHVDLTLSESLAGPGVCDPLSSVALLFTTPVHALDLKAALQLQPDLLAGRTDDDPWGHAQNRHKIRVAHRRGQSYPAWLPQRLQAHQGYRVRTTAGLLKDAFSRPLVTAMDMQFGTAHRRPKLDVTHPNAVLEAGIDSEVPVYVTNLDALQLRFQTIQQTAMDESADSAFASKAARPPVSRTRRIQLPDVEDLAFAVPLQARAMLDGRSGAVYGTISSSPATGNEQDRYFFAQVTPFSVTVKLGHFSSIAWVTRLDDGTPVANASVRIYRARYGALAGTVANAGPHLSSSEASKFGGPLQTNQHGVAQLPGASTLDPTLQALHGWRRNTPRFFVHVQSGDDLALLPLDNDYRVWTRDVWPNPEPAFGHLKAWGTTAQGIYRAGDVIQYKIYVRHQDTHTLVAAPRAGYQLSVIDPKGEPLISKLAVTLNAFGAFDGELVVPRNAAVGWYRFELHNEHGKRTLEALRVLVSDFTPSPFKVRTMLNGDHFRVGDQLHVDTAANLHSGGPYTDAQARVTVRVNAQALRPKHPLASRFHFDTSVHDSAARGWQVVHQDQRKLDGRGERTTQFTLADYGVLYGRVQVESAVQDERGKRVSALASAQFTARDRFVGLRSTKWLHTQGESVRIQYLVIDASGSPVDNVPVALTISREKVVSARVKGAGNAYQTHYERRWIDEATCNARATLSASDCHFTPRHAGRYRIRATIADSHGRAHQSELITWVQGSSQVLWQQPEDGSLSIIAERERYKVGDTARFLVQNPYPGAQALVAIERYGVLRSWTQALQGSTPVIAFEVLRDDLPGFHLSVTVMSPRVQAPPPKQGQVDLGKPAMRMGYVRVPVDDPYKRLKIAITPERAVYKPREQARVEFQVLDYQRNEALTEPVELAIAVLDEAVFDLIGAGSANFDPYRGFYKLDNLDVVSYALLTRLIGRQKFESKGANSGGDGAGQALGLRDLFKFVSYWNPSVSADANGRASIEVSLPDNLTGWRVLAMAATDADRLGLGEATFKVNKDTELRPVMPNHVRAGDRFDGTFTVLNRSAAARTLHVTLSASGSALAAQSEVEHTVTVAAFARARVAISVATVRAGELLLNAVASDEHDTDRLQHSLNVHDTHGLYTAASYGDISADNGQHPNTANDGVDIAVAIPAQALPGHGAIALVATPSVIGDTAGAFDYMRDYPYMCWEQRLSKGVMASHFQSLKPYLADEVTWPESRDLPAQMLNDAARFQAPNGGMCFWLAQDARVSPYLSAYTAIAFDWLQRAGAAPSQVVQQRLDAYLRTMLRRDVFPQHYSVEMTSNVRAVALAALARRKVLDDDDVLRYRSQLPRMSVFAKAHFLEAVFLTLGEHPVVDEVLAALLAHGHQSAGKYSLSDAGGQGQDQGQDDNDGHRYLLETPARANCAALSSLTAVAQNPQLGKQVLPLAQKMVRSISAARGRRNHWQNTQENAFCMAALADYARRFEATTPDLTLRASISDEPLGELSFSAFNDPAATVSRPIRVTDVGQSQVLQLRSSG